MLLNLTTLTDVNIWKLVHISKYSQDKYKELGYILWDVFPV